MHRQITRKKLRTFFTISLIVGLTTLGVVNLFRTGAFQKNWLMDSLIPLLTGATLVLIFNKIFSKPLRLSVLQLVRKANKGVRRRGCMLQSLRNATLAIASSPDVGTVLRTVNEETTRLLGVTKCAISKWDTQEDSVYLLAEDGPPGLEDSTPGEHYYLKDYPATKKVLHERIPLQMTVSQPEIDPAEHRLMKEYDAKTLLLVPIIYHDRVTGLFEVYDHKMERTFADDEIAVAQTLANQAAVAIKNSQLHAETERQLEVQTALRDLRAVLLSTLDLEIVLSRIAEHITKIVGATSAYILTADPDTCQSTVVAEYFSPHAHEKEKVSDLGVTYSEGEDSKFWQRILNGEIDIAHIDDLDLPDNEREHMAEYAAKTILYIPLLYKKQFFTFIEIWESRRIRQFAQEEIDLCLGIAQQASIAVANARLFAQTQQEIQERKKAQEALRVSEERYSLAAKAANDGLWDWDLRNNVIYYSARWKSILGLGESEVGNQPKVWFSRVHPEDRTGFQVALSAHIEGLSSQFECEHRLLHNDGDYRWVLSRGLAVRDGDGNPYRLAGSLSDITERKRNEQQLVHDAFHDTLTGLPNRALFFDRLDHAIKRCKENESNSFAVLFIDFDRFKLVNDSLGHSAGDKLLRKIASRLELRIRERDTLARLGGDEYVILLEDGKNLGNASEVAGRILEEFKQPFFLGTEEIYITASIGVAYSDVGYKSAEDVMRDADIAMYHAKKMGKAQYVVFEPSMRTLAMARLSKENDLRRAIENQEFRLHYQPIVSQVTNRISGFEALIRWQHPRLGLVPPVKFIPLAEETGMIVPIGLWVLEESCRQVKEWQDRYAGGPPLTISVNISNKQLQRRDFVERVSQILEGADLEAASLKLEITESVLMEDSVTAKTTLSRLTDLGVQIQIDDFGTGYSSLNYLHQFPISAIKIDRSFVGAMEQDENNANIVQTIVMLAHNMGMSAIAEGVETPGQQSRLKKLNCEFVQGDLFSKPVESEAAGALIEEDFQWETVGVGNLFVKNEMVSVRSGK